jgi:NACHT domain
LAKITDDFDRATAVDTLQAVQDTREYFPTSFVVTPWLILAIAGDRYLLQQILKPVDEATYDPDRGCFEGTRQDILPKIFNWASEASSPEKIWWLYGTPGSGKTSVATSLCDMLHTSKSLAASFFCRRDDPILSKPEILFPTLIYHLASTWGPYRKLVVKALRGDSKLQPKLTKRLFDDLVTEPLQTLDQHPTRTLVIVIDALDEYGDIDSRKNLLSNILTATSTVSWLKVVVTSRHDHDIEEGFAKLKSESYVSLDLNTAHNAQTDIRLFAEKKLAALGARRHIPNWPSEELLDVVMERSGGLFISVRQYGISSKRVRTLMNFLIKF